MKRLFNYTTLLIKYEFLKKENKRNLVKLDKYQLENQTLRQCLSSEEKRAIKFYKSYRNKFNEYEDLINLYNKVAKERNVFEKKIKKLEKENK